MIQHTVAFRLAQGADEDGFWRRVDGLSQIPGVSEFRILRQVGRKNDYTHALSMWFESQQKYDGYDTHPDHVAFVEEAWLPNVAEFIELDYVAQDA